VIERLPNKLISVTDLVLRHEVFASRGVPIYERMRFGRERPPDLHEGQKNIGRDGSRRCISCKYGTAAEERLVVGANICGKVVGNEVCDALLVAHPLEELLGEWCYREGVEVNGRHPSRLAVTSDGDAETGLTESGRGA